MEHYFVELAFLAYQHKATLSSIRPAAANASLSSERDIKILTYDVQSRTGHSAHLLPA